MNHKLEIQITTDANSAIGKLNPCESYAAQILEDAKAGFQKFRWDTIPNDERPYLPTFKIFDETAGLVTELSRTDNTGKFARGNQTLRHRRVLFCVDLQESVMNRFSITAIQIKIGVIS